MKLKTLFFLFSSSLMSKFGVAMITTTHIKCLGGVYPRSSIQRLEVPHDKLSWFTNFEDYKPPTYTSPEIHGKPWADPELDDPYFKPKWNSIDGNISRISYTGEYMVVDGAPLNPNGRTGIAGRGVLGRWGPNHAADPVVTRWKLLPNGSKEFSRGRPVAQFVAIKRRDTEEWALPGGMVDPGEDVATTAIREFQEEAVNSLQMTEKEKQEWQAKFNKLFSGGELMYRGYVDDPRNTDNAWMETAGYNFHHEDGDTVRQINLTAGDDAVGAKWVDIDSQVNLYASHKAIVRAVAQKLDAHWY